MPFSSVRLWRLDRPSVRFKLHLARPLKVCCPATEFLAFVRRQVRLACRPVPQPRNEVCPRHGCGITVAGRRVDVAVILRLQGRAARPVALPHRVVVDSGLKAVLV